MRNLALAAALALAAVVPGPRVAAESLAVLAVAEPPGPSSDLAELTHQVRSLASERAKGVLDAAQLRDRMTGQIATASLAELDRAYSGAMASSQNGDFEGAVRTLRAIIDDLEKLPDGPETFDQWARAMMRLARSEQTLGKKDEARVILERLVRAAPDIKVDSTQYPPSFEKQITELRSQLKALPTQKLTVQASVKGARVFVEGREAGTAPVSLSLPRGQYHVSGRVGSLRVPAVTVDLSEESQTVTLNFALAEALRPNTGPGLALPDIERSKGVVVTGAFLGVDRVIATGLISQADVTYLLGSYYDVRRGMLLREGRVRLSNGGAPPGSLSALVGFLITGQPSSLVAATAVAPTPAGAPSRSTTGTGSTLTARPPTGPDLSVAGTSGTPSKALGWTAFGTGVLTAGLVIFGVVESSAANGKYADAKTLLNPDGSLKTGTDPVHYNQLIKDGDSARTMSTVGFVGAAASAVATGILGYLAYQQTGEIGPFRF